MAYGAFGGIASAIKTVVNIDVRKDKIVVKSTKD